MTQNESDDATLHEEDQSDTIVVIADIESRQDDVIYRLDELNERIENLIELYNRIRELPDGGKEAKAA